jgi:hypothetical protein
MRTCQGHDLLESGATVHVDCGGPLMAADTFASRTTKRCPKCGEKQRRYSAALADRKYRERKARR